jgi:two-component system CheB/CheR fusion protein
LEAARTFRPEVVLLDIGLPGMDGYEVARRLRADRATADALLIAVTGWGQERDRERVKAAGFDHHLVKPLDPDTLKTILTAHTPGPTGSGAPQAGRIGAAEVESWVAEGID